MFLAYVVSAVILLSAIAVSFLTASTASYRVSRNALQAAQSEAAVDAAIARAVLGLLDPRRERRWRVDGTPQDYVFGEVRMRIAVQDELGRIDLNHGDRSVVLGLFQSVGLGLDAAGALADKVLAWRGGGPGRAPGGAGAPDGRSSGFAYVPRNGPFQSVDELRLVTGMTPELYRRVEPALTVYSGRPFLDPQFAPAEALAALPGQSRDTAAAVIAARRTGGRDGTIDPAVAVWGRAFAIRVEMPQPDGALTREVVVRLADQPSQPYWLLSWRNK
ncbi:MAG TPA: type II secretion system protein GspK [Hyphomicrobiaceae bacterium]|jgi:general secretion pathway protein K